MFYWAKLKSPLGELYILATPRAIVKMAYGAEYFEFEGAHSQTPLLNEARRQIAAYFSGKLKTFDLPVAIPGTEFQRAVYRAMKKIPYGQLKSYGEVAVRIHHPRASRAVGTACARNQLPLIIPCHRVVASNGIGGYGGSLWMKQWLLAHEAKFK